MNKINIFSYAVAEYRIQNIGVEIYYAPAVLDAYFSKTETIRLLESNSKKRETFDGIFNITQGPLATRRKWISEEMRLTWKPSGPFLFLLSPWPVFTVMLIFPKALGMYSQLCRV